MKKLVKGIVEFRHQRLPEYCAKFAQLALGQSPDALFIACSDSRVVPNLFASTDPGDLFVVRNVGNLIPKCGVLGHSSADESEAAAIEFSLLHLNVSDIIVCGHSDCGAMHSLLEGRDRLESPNLRAWLRHAEPSLARMNESESSLSQVNQLSQANVLQQLHHLRSYPVVNERLVKGSLRLHAWWFDLSTANVFAYKEDRGEFVIIEDEEAAF